MPLRSDLGLPVYLIIALYSIGAYIAIIATDAAQAFAFDAYLVVWPVVFLLLFPAIYALFLLLRIVHRFETRRGRRLAIRLAASPRYVRQFLTGLALLLALMVFQGAFTSLKTALPLWRGGFTYDLIQADIDQVLHFGVDPWRYLHSNTLGDWLRPIVEWNYNQGWFVVCYATLFFVAVSTKAEKIRTRYLITYMLTWIIVGNLLAGIFLSAGPAFYGHVTGDHARFSEQLTLLAQSGDSNHSAKRMQDYLWHFYASGQSGLGSGISAFPSMHVGLVTLNALFIAEISWRWGAIAFAYVAFVLASSVYLAWHYAIDGYAAIFVSVAIFLVTKELTAKARRA